MFSRWWRDDDPEFEQLGMNLELPEVRTTATGRYRCVVRTEEPPWEEGQETTEIIVYCKYYMSINYINLYSNILYMQ